MKQLLSRLRRLPHPTILGLIVAAVTVFLIDVAFGLELGLKYGARPIEFRNAWTELRDGVWNLGGVAVVGKLFAPLMLHAGIEHILVNLVFLWAFGSLTSQILGRWWAVVFFWVCGACGNILQICMNPDSMIPIVGASGAVCGFEGIYFGLALRWHLRWPDVWPLAHPIPPLQLGAFAACGIAFDIYSLMNHRQSVAYGAHFGGFLSGLAVAALVTQFYPTIESFQRRESRAGQGR